MYVSIIKTLFYCKNAFNIDSSDAYFRATARYDLPTCAFCMVHVTDQDPRQNLYYELVRWSGNDIRTEDRSLSNYDSATLHFRFMCNYTNCPLAQEMSFALYQVTGTSPSSF
jgi:hypothetical protein